jgi:hypothetical protein
MKAWLHDWPRNRDLLEASYAGARIHGKSAYEYNPVLRDLRARFRDPTTERLAEARARVVHPSGASSDSLTFQCTKPDLHAECLVVQPSHCEDLTTTASASHLNSQFTRQS